jgi:YVTN family beta-propeller protein
MAVKGGTLFVATDSKEETATVVVIDLTGKTPPRVLSVPAAGPGFSSLVVSPDGTTLYGLSAFENLLAEVDISTGSLLATYSVNTYENNMALTPDGAKLYVSNQFSNDLTVIDTASGAITTIDVGSPTNFVAAR